jgi:hypothetical protein
VYSVDTHQRLASVHADGLRLVNDSRHSLAHRQPREAEEAIQSRSRDERPIVWDWRTTQPLCLPYLATGEKKRLGTGASAHRLQKG